MKNKIIQALNWIVKILENNNIQYQITGGFATNVYGSDRKTYDIDIDIKEDDFENLLPYVQKHLIYGPNIYTDEKWSLKLMSIEYKGQLIDIGGAYETKIYNKIKSQRESLKVDLSKSQTIEYHGLKISVIMPTQLLNYKSKLGRNVDLIDIEFLESYIENTIG
ncbi:MAG: hypothetical protein V3575_05775 [Candidatus Absconditabacteria bacterium]